MKKAIWLHLSQRDTAEKIKIVVQNMKKMGIDIVYPLIKEPSGCVNYHSSISPVNPLFSSFDPLETLIRESGKYGMEIHPWICVFLEGANGIKSPIVQKNPSLLVVNKDGSVGIEKEYWAAPHSAYLEYLKKMAEELLKNYDVHGIHLDYIRYAGREYDCFCPECTRKFEEYHQAHIDILHEKPWLWHSFCMKKTPPR